MNYYLLKNTNPQFCGLVPVVDYIVALERPELWEEAEYVSKCESEPLPSLENWKPIRYRPYREAGKNTTVADFDSLPVIVSSRVIETLGDFFHKHGDFYPLIVEDYNDDDRQFFMYQCRTIIDCLDETRSEGEYYGSNTERMTLVHTAFFMHEKIPDNTDIFSIPYGTHKRDIFVSERVRDALKTIQPPLTGFELVAEGENQFADVFVNIPTGIK